MNKKQILKEQKKLKAQRKEVSVLFNDDKDVYKIFKILIGVVLFIGIAFALINILNGTWNLFGTKSVHTTEIDSSMLMVGNMFNKEDDEYLVLAYDMDKEENNFYGALTENYYGSQKLYYIDLSSGFNRDFIGNKTVISEDLSKLKFGGATLLVVNKDKITKSYITEKEIVDYFTKQK